LLLILKLFASSPRLVADAGAEQQQRRARPPRRTLTADFVGTHPRAKTAQQHIAALTNAADRQRMRRLWSRVTSSSKRPGLEALGKAWNTTRLAKGDQVVVVAEGENHQETGDLHPFEIFRLPRNQHLSPPHCWMLRNFKFSIVSLR